MPESSDPSVGKAFGPERRVFTLPEGTSIAFRHIIPGGPFQMGSRGYDSLEEPVHLVEFQESFWMAETPLTQCQFSEWIRAAGIQHKNHFEGRPENPAENMDWHQANRYCAWLSEMIPQLGGDPVPEGFGLFRLPMEAEWEYACRAGTETEYSTGDGESALREAGWFEEDWEKGSTHPVRGKIPNRFGLFDMHGNVWEWCLDVFDIGAYRKRTGLWRAREWTLEDADEDATHLGRPWKRGEEADRVLRGGSWDGSAWLCRSAFRYGGGPGGRDRDGGFRVCLVRGPKVETEQKGVESKPATGVEGRGTRTETDGDGRSGRRRSGG